jgi:hypothetical protein
MDTDAIARVRAAIKDRAVWFAFLYEEFARRLPEAEVEQAARRAIFEFGRLKGKSDVQPFDSRAWVERHKQKGSADVFDSDVEVHDGYAVQQMKRCALVEAWKELGYPPEKVALFCDIAMEGDRGRADFHGIRMELKESLGKGDCFCCLVITDGKV